VDLAEAGWLSLKILEGEDPTGTSPRPSLRISVSKKIVRLATRRNRIKRLVREAWRSVGAPKDSNKIYLFHVEKIPARDLGLKDAQAAVKSLLCSKQ